MQWEIKTKIRDDSPEERREEILATLITNRGLTQKKEVQEFLKPPKPETLSPKRVGISQTQLEKASKRIKMAIKKQEPLIVYGDYDADGICATAILWETLFALGAKAMPFIPRRKEHGYGLSIKGIDEILKDAKPPLIITVDNGIVAHPAVDYANSKGIDVIICDHHQQQAKLPGALSIIHSTDLAGSGVAWIFAKEIVKNLKTISKAPQSLDLVTIGSIADMVPLLGANRILVKHGMSHLRRSQRVGINEIYKEAALNPTELSTYHINFIIAPRLNASGRLEHAIDSLRLLCTKKRDQASSLAVKLGKINRRRQELTQELLSHAKNLYSSGSRQEVIEKIIIIDHEDYHEGIIGLIAGKLVEEFYRPAIVLSRGEKISKASARSINGFNIIEAIRESQDLLVDAGGHPMAAGFTIESKKINAFKESMQEIAARNIRADLLEPKLRIDCEITLKDITWALFREIEEFEPFGIGNPRPRFAARNCEVIEARTVGGEGKHLKLKFRQNGSLRNGIAFNFGFLAPQLEPGSSIDLAFTIEKNIWNAREELQLQLKDIQGYSRNA